MFAGDIEVFLSEIFLGSSILGILVYGVLLSTSVTYKYPLVHKNIYFLSCFVLLLTGILCLCNPVDYALIFQKNFICDDLSKISKLVILGSSMLTLIITQSYIKTYKINNYEYFLLILLSIFGLNLLISSNDFLSAYLAIELQSLSFYVLASFQRKSIFSAEAGLKYFILGGFSSGLVLYGFSLIYGITGTTNLYHLSLLCIDNNFSGYEISSIGLIFIIAGLLFKLGAFPFHMWLPDVYEGAPTSITSYFAIVPKLGVLILFSRLIFCSFSTYYLLWEKMLLFSSICSIAYSSIVAIKQHNLKRLLAYSSIGHVGYMLLALAADSADGMQALIFYFFVYILSSIPIWSLVVYCMKKRKDSQTNINILSALPNTSPVLALAGGLGFFSLAGIPPLVGFYSKVFVFFSAVKSSLYLSVFVILILNVISTYYYISIIKTIYFEKNISWIFYNSLAKDISITIGVVLILLLFFFFDSSLLKLVSEKMIFSLVEFGF
uniref:NADH dehydrogenase subunit 2 n=1 Tax=Vischeria stellata TaxID=1104407 RepID=A0A481XFS8_9STRA|nr:NADH dehydrogenase subunit 2 [Vischeria stellata]QBK36856.1 NADH dehydrogenase subunit 2 [Vischeria stellata]